MQWVSELVFLLGTFFCHKGAVHYRGTINRYLFWFFSLKLFSQTAGIVYTLLLPMHPTSEWLEEYSLLSARVNSVISAIGLIATVALVVVS